MFHSRNDSLPFSWGCLSLLLCHILAVVQVLLWRKPDLIQRFLFIAVLMTFWATFNITIISRLLRYSVLIKLHISFLLAIWKQMAFIFWCLLKQINFLLGRDKLLFFQMELSLFVQCLATSLCHLYVLNIFAIQWCLHSGSSSLKKLAQYLNCTDKITFFLLL